MIYFVWIQFTEWKISSRLHLPLCYSTKKGHTIQHVSFASLRKPLIWLNLSFLLPECDTTISKCHKHNSKTLVWKYVFMSYIRVALLVPSVSTVRTLLDCNTVCSVNQRRQAKSLNNFLKVPFERKFQTSGMQNVSSIFHKLQLCNVMKAINTIHMTVTWLYTCGIMIIPTTNNFIKDSTIRK